MDKRYSIMLRSFKRVLLRKKCYNSIFATNQQNESFAPVFPGVRRRSEKIIHKRGFDTEMTVNGISEVNLNAKLIDLNYSSESVTKDKVDDILNDSYQYGSINHLFENIVPLFRHGLLDCEPKDKIQFMKSLVLEVHQPDVYHYNTLISIYLDNNIDFLPDEFLTDLYRQNIEPNEETWYLILKYYCLKSMISNANNTLPKIQHKEWRSYFRKICADLEIACEKPRNLKETIYMDNLKEKPNFPEDFNTYTAFMCIHAMQNDIESIRYIHNVCTNNSVKISAIDANRVLYTLITSGYQTSIPEVVNIFTSKQDCRYIVRLILQLLSLGQEKFAIELWVKHWDDTLKANINEDAYKCFFFRRLFRNSSNLEETHKMAVEKCKEYNMLVRYQVLDGFNKDADFVKYRSYIRILLNENKYRLKSLHFWPLLAKCDKDMDTYGILHIIDYMVNQCQIQPCFDTLRIFVVPRMTRSNYFINLLRYLRVKEDTINNAIAYSFLHKDHVKKAYQYLWLHESTYSYSLLGKVLLDALVSGQDVEAFIKIARLLKEVSKNGSLHASKYEENITSVPIDEFVLQIYQNFPEEKILLRKLLHTLRSQDITLTENTKRIMKMRPNLKYVIEFPLESCKMSPEISCEHNKDSRLLAKLNSALKHFYVNSDSFIPVTTVSEGIAQLMNRHQQLMQYNATLLQFLEKYFILTNSTAVGEALEKCRITYKHREMILNPIKSLIKQENIKESMLKIWESRWHIVKLVEDQEIEHSNQLTQTLICVFRSCSYGPMAVLSILEYMSAKYHFLPQDMGDLMREFQKLGKDEYSQKFISIYEKLNNQLEDADKALKTDINSEYSVSHEKKFDENEILHS